MNPTGPVAAPRIDIVIPSAGRPVDLLQLLHSLHEQCAASLPGMAASITVTDDRHSPALAAQLRDRYAQVSYVPGPARGPAANRNHGASHGSAEWILFLDDDCYLQCDLLQAYALQTQVHPQPSVIEGAIHSVGERPNGNHHAPLNVTGGFLWSCNMLVQRRGFESIGRFDEQFPFACMEDVDLRERLKDRGDAIVFAPDAIVLHPWRSISEREVSRQIISHAIYADKHREFARVWTLRHVARMIRTRLRLYTGGGFSTIPWSKYRTVALDLVAPMILCVVARVPPIRRSLSTRYRNRHLEVARLDPAPARAQPL